MALEIPGLSLSLLRQDTATQAGKPVLVSGRFTALGLGVPGLIRVSLNGPSYNPEIRTFDAFAQPFSGDWSVQVVTEKDGQYTLKAQAYPLPAIPSGPAFPENILLFPPIAESTEPPLVVGAPTEGGVTAQVPEGSEFLAAPAQTPIELMTSVGAPSVFVTAPSVPTTPTAGISLPPTIVIEPPATPVPTPAAPTPAAPTEIPTPTIPEIPEAPEIPEPEVEAEVEAPSLPTASMLGFPTSSLPSQLNIGDIWYGNVQVPTNIPSSLLSVLSLPYYTFRVTVSLEDPKGQMIPVVSRTTSPQLGQPLNVPVDFPTTGLEEGRYNVYLEIADEAGNSLFNNIIGRLYLVALPGEELPISAPEFPMPSMFGTPSLSAPASVTQGETWSGRISVPTVFPSSLPAPPAPPTYGVNLGAELLSPTGQRFPVGQVTPSFQPGQSLSLPFNFDTGQLSEAGRYSCLMSVKDAQGNIILPAEIIGMLEVLLSSLPSLPSIEDVSFGTPSLSAPASVTQGDTWSGRISVPTSLPSIPGISLPATLPTLPVTLGAELQSPTGQRFPVGQATPSFQPGQGLSLPFNFNTGQLPGAGDYDVVMSLKDMTGNNLLPSGVPGLNLGKLKVLGAAAPELSQFPLVTVALSPRTVKVGDTVTIPVTYTHIGAPDKRTIRAAIGQSRGEFDEILWAEVSINVPLDAVPTPRTANVPVVVTNAISPGTYGIYGKVKGTALGGLIGQTVSRPVWNVVTVVRAPALTATPSLKQGEKLSFSFEGFQAGTSVNIYVQGGGGLTMAANSQGAGSNSFRVGESAGRYTLVAKDGYGHQATAPFTVTESLPEPTARVTNSPVTPGSRLTATFSGFTPNTSVYAAARTIGNFGATANSQGSGTLSALVPAGMEPGTYSLAVRDSLGRSTTTKFAVKALTPTGTPTLTATSSLKTQEILRFSFANFQPNASVNIYVQGGGGLTMAANGLGAGSSSFRVGEGPGRYTLVAKDGYGHQATASFTVT
jgi:hypothetical protein